MNVNLSNLINKGETVAVALSGGSDSMALLYYMISQAEKLPFNLIAINVEHGIRGEESLLDSKFVASQCKALSVPLLTYSIDCVKEAKKQKLSIEQVARKLRYECFYDALSKGKCDKIATAHHNDDNVESVLFNLFRGTGIKGLTGIKENYENKIIRPFLSVKKAEILKYVEENAIPFVTDSTNLSDEYTRNFLRLNVIPKIREVFPDFDQSIYALSKIAKREDEYMDSEAKKAVIESENTLSILTDTPKAIFYRAVFIILKKLGLEKDWESVHADAVYSLVSSQNASMVNLPKNIVAIREYERIVFFKEEEKDKKPFPFSLGNFTFGDKTIIVNDVLSPDLKSGLFGDLDKIPKGAIIRKKQDGDQFAKFGGGTKSLSDFLTDKKIPLRERDNLPLLASGKEILCIFGVAISNKIKVDDNTKKTIQFSIK